MSGRLYLVGTPIGNLGDISSRAVKTLEGVDFIAAEDTRVTLKLLNYLGIKKPLVSYYQHNRMASGEKILERLLDGENCALVSDAGMPVISDPGEDMVALCSGAGIEVTVIPGPCAAVSALTLSGLPSGRFTFEGFLSTAKKSRFSHLEELKTEQRTMIFYEAPHKLCATLHDMLKYFGNRRISICREITKIHEETLRFNTLEEAVRYYDENIPKGEFVLIVEGCSEKPGQAFTNEYAVELALRYISTGNSAKDAVKKSAEETGVPKNIIYDKVMRLKKQAESN